MSTDTKAEMDARLQYVIDRQNGSKKIYLGFSCGKESIATWLYLRDNGFEVIPFYGTMFPRSPLVDKQIDYYEKYFKTKIIRMIDPVFWDIQWFFIWQTPEAALYNLDFAFDTHTMHDVTDYLRLKDNANGRWAAFGITMYDSIDRRVYCLRRNGVNQTNRTFYPIMEWSPKQVLKIIEENRVELPVDYQYGNRSMRRTNANALNFYRKECPEYLDTLQALCPMLEADEARRMIFGIAERAKKASKANDTVKKEEAPA